MMLFVLCFLFTYLFGDSTQPFFYFILVVTCGLFTSVLVCIDNLKTFSKYAKESQEFDDEDVYFRTCPDYWTKRRVVDPTTKLPHTMCYNTMQNDMFVSGSLTNNDANTYLGTTITDLRASMSNASMSNAVIASMSNAVIASNADLEGFTNLNPEDPEYEENLHTHTSVDLIVNSNLSTDSGSNASPHGHIFLGSTSGTHSHKPGEGGFWGDTGVSPYTADFDNFDNWINPHNAGNGRTGMELNLTKLNEADNKCEIANTFPWVEAYTKCA
jgi:hypothetical protein